jgi:hypothetical protein
MAKLLNGFEFYLALTDIVVNCNYISLRDLEVWLPDGKQPTKIELVKGDVSIGEADYIQISGE